MMKSKVITSALALALLMSVQASLAQQVKGTMTQEKQGEKTTPTPSNKPGERLEPNDAPVVRPRMSQEARANRVEQRPSEEAAVASQYNSFLSEYRLGPEDVISVSVFGQERYSRANITIPPHGELAYPLIPEGIIVVGKTTRQVSDEIAKHLDEYIIDPKVTVTLEKANSHQFSVLGDVAQPGIRLMTRRLTVYEALLQAGGVLGTGNKKKVVLIRHGADRMLTQRVIDVAAIEKGRAPDNTYLSPGDQIFVPGNRMKTVNKILEILPVISFARIFTGGW